MSRCKKASEHRRNPQNRGSDSIHKMPLRGHTWKVEKKVLEDGTIVKGVRRCDNCGYTPETWRVKLDG